MRKYAALILFTLLSCSALLAQNWDVATVHKVNGWNGKFMHDFSDVVSKTEPYVAFGVPVVMAVVGLARHDKELQKNALFVGTSVAGSFAISYGLKYIVNRDRPYVAHPDLVTPHSTDSAPSFPSGHTASAFALATSLSMAYPKWYVIAPSALWACSVGVSRLYEGVHYPSDVIVGAAIGVGTTFLSVYLSRQLSKWLLGD